MLSLSFAAVEADAPYVSVVYPRASVDAAGTTADAAVAQRAADAINAYVTSITMEFGGSTAWMNDPSTNREGTRGELRLTATQRLSTPHLTLVTLEGYEYTGGAHGLPLLYTAAFDPASGARITWSDAITGTGFGVVSAEVRRQVAANTDVQATDEWLMSGSQEPANVGLWWPADDGLHLTYQPYSVGPYSIGTPEVTIPWSLIADHLVADLPIRP